jgi:hypothetical protein
MQKQYEITSELWLYSAGKAAWHFITIPEEPSAEIKFFSGDAKVGFGSVRVCATVGKTTWKTSIFPDSKTGCYFLPVKAEVRKKEALNIGDKITLLLDLNL